MTGTWQALTNQPTFNTGTMILLTDGRVMVQEGGSNHWYALKPDKSGNYANGTWSQLADMNHSRLYYASGVLKDGRVIFCGGEYSDAGGDTNACEIYDPVLNAWTVIPSPPGWPIVGDAACCVLPDGRFMIGALTNRSCAIYDPETNSWSPAASKAVRSNEETWVLLPDDTILTPQCFSPFKSEKYIISSNTWQNEGPVPVPLVNPNMHEIGPAMLLYNGKVIFFGAEKSAGNGKTAIYTLPAMPTGTGTWVAGPDIPKASGKTMVCNDCPASLLPNGKVLFTAANYLPNDWGSPILFFEYDPVSNTIAQAPTPPNNAVVLYESRLMLLPTGQVLFSPSSNNVQCYTPDGGPQDAWRPTISSIAPHRVASSSTIDYYILKGTLLNGWSQANMYGDDCYAATNYPLVRLRNTCSNKIYYCRTFNFSTMGVATGTTEQCCNFSTANVPEGEYDLVVVANGISSAPITVQLPMPMEMECCSCSEVSMNLPPICEDCIAPPAPDWVDCNEGMRWFFPLYVTKQTTVTRGEFPATVTVQFEIVYEYDLKYRGRQQGKLLFTTSLIPQEEVKIYQYDRYRKTRSESSRFSVHSSFRQSVSALFQTRFTSDLSSFAKNITSVRASGDTSSSLAGLLLGGVEASVASTSETGVSLNVSSDIFSQVLSSASSMVEAERSLVITTYEDIEQINVTSRVLKNYNNCRAVTYYIRRVNEVYDLFTSVRSVRWRIGTTGGQFSDWQTEDGLSSLPDDLQKFIKSELAKLPQPGAEVKGATCVSIPSDGTVYEAELAHCASCDPEREAEVMIALERAKSEARKLCLEAELLSLEVERRKALLAKADLSSFEPAAIPAP